MQSFSLEGTQGTLEGLVALAQTNQVRGVLKPFNYSPPTVVGVFQVQGVVESATIHEFMDVALALGATQILAIAEANSDLLKSLGFTIEQQQTGRALWRYQ